MDMSKVIWALVAFGIGLAIGNCISWSALFAGICLMASAVYVGTAILNGLGMIDQTLREQSEQPEERRPIGFEQNLVDVDDPE